MVKPEELMIGNLIILDQKVTEVKTISGYSVNSRHESLRDEIGSVEIVKRGFTIDLTKDWLEKLGFEYYEPLDHWRIIHNECWYEVHGRNGFYWFTFSNLLRDEYRSMPDRKVQYVHQLQNLFYCLSGRKLKLINE
jgi:hypothetical protein